MENKTGFDKYYEERMNSDEFRDAYNKALEEFKTNQVAEKDLFDHELSDAANMLCLIQFENAGLSGPHSKESRQAIFKGTKEILESKRCYAGYRYLQQHEVPEGELPGIRTLDGPIEKKFENTDETRVAFLVPARIRHAIRAAMSYIEELDKPAQYRATQTSIQPLFLCSSGD